MKVQIPLDLDFAMLVFCQREVELMVVCLSMILIHVLQVDRDYVLLHHPAQGVERERGASVYQKVKDHPGRANIEL